MRLTVIGTFYRRWENSLPLLKRLYVDSTRTPDEAFLLCETDDDKDALHAAYQELYDLELLDGWPDGLTVETCPTPRLVENPEKYAVIPYSFKLNAGLDRASEGAIVYLDNGSDPKPDKYRVLTEGLERNPGWGGTYCSQKRTGMNDLTMEVGEAVGDPFCVLNYTQIAHRLTEDRWPLDMALANPDVADGHFLRLVADRLGPFHPVGTSEPLDEHHIPDAAASGIRTGT